VYVLFLLFVVELSNFIYVRPMDDVDREGQDSCQRLWLCNAKLYGSMVDHMMWCVSLVPSSQQASWLLAHQRRNFKSILHTSRNDRRIIL